jgi:hypothetical protein
MFNDHDTYSGGGNFYVVFAGFLIVFTSPLWAPAIGRLFGF